ncbi:YagK/YfjJ domain-containing protein [Vreelandella salicampi]|uniref:Inovirus-type Gp2 protein n=1 Tax=Vreelandella salicampi TaxID=1449798 RepID=A0A7Z0LIR2_9GAMM|nr:inovirus-type Gp2 protein [Halomonas salicampi]NYS59685.1 inovirus-type Gp2 protein [Halomonas salicampi]
MMNLSFHSIRHGRKCHPDNLKLRLWWEAGWYDMPVNTAHGPLIENYLNKAHTVMNQALNAHSRLLAVPVLLRYPKAMPADQLRIHNLVISRFVDFLNWELGLIELSHDPDMRYIWCREQDTSDKPHYHMVLLFNGHALQHLGALSAYIDGSDEAYSGDCLYHRLVRAWAWAIGWQLEEMKGLVNITTNSMTKDVCVFRLHSRQKAMIREFFFAISYLCKAHSKPIGQGVHCFDGSKR